ncbi:MAG: helix-turn-helix domain-containing protein [Mucinivorans sp.]
MNTQLSAKELADIRTQDFSKLPGFVNAETRLTEQYGAKGTPTRSEFEAKAKAWYYGEILREKRKELKITQKELAERIGRERTYINRIEQGTTDMQLSTFLRIVEALGIEMSLVARLA